MKINSKLIDKTDFIKNTKNNSTIDTYSCDYSNKAFGGKILWTNPNPTSNFGAQTIQLSSTDYDVLEIFYVTIKASTNQQVKSIRSIKGYNAILDYYDGYSSKGALRTVSINGNQVTFSNSFYNSGTGSQNYCVPIYIVGYKTGLF